MSVEQQFRENLLSQYKETRKKSLELHKEACRFLPGGDTRTVTYFDPFPHYIVRGDGAYLYDADGNQLIDFQNNYTSLIHGHNHKPTVEAIKKQVSLGTAYAAPFENQTKLAKLLTERVPSIDLIRFTNSGTEANMHVLRIARAYTKKSKIIKTEGGYHGTTDVFEASVDPNLKKAGTLENIKVIPESKGVSKNALKDVLVVPFNDIKNTQIMIEKHHDDIACFIIEPVMASAGQIVPCKEYLEFLREITAHYGILLIFDEVVTFRLSTGGAQGLYDIHPDLTSLGKIIGGGTPIGAFGGKEEIMRMYDPKEKKMYHSGTFNGNALAMAAGIATMKAFDESSVNKINSIGRKFKNDLENIFLKLGLDLQVSGTGSLLNIIFSNKSIRNYRDVASSYEKLNELLFLSLLTKGIFNAPRGMFCMSTAMTLADIDKTIGKLEESLSEMLPVISEVAPELIK